MCTISSGFCVIVVDLHGLENEEGLFFECIAVASCLEHEYNVGK